MDSPFPFFETPFCDIVTKSNEAGTRVATFFGGAANRGKVEYTYSVPDQNACACGPGTCTEFMRCGVMVRMTSVVTRWVLNELIRLPRKGISPIQGIVTLVRRSSYCKRPPNTIVSPSRTFSMVSA